MSPKIGKLEKLAFTAYKDVRRKKKLGSAFAVMFNPTSWSQSYGIDYSPKQGINTSAAHLKYSTSTAENLTLELVFDGTLPPETDSEGQPPNVKSRVQAFLDLTWKYNGSMHEPPYLQVKWGALLYDCRLSRVDVKYTLFDRNGKPLRAELTVVLLSDKSAKQRAQEENKQSPDLTHARIVRAGDTLPLLTSEIYGSPAAYLAVARWNELDDFRNLKPGTELLFPPLSALSPGARGKEEG